MSSRSALLDSFCENEYTSYDIRNEEIYHDLCAIDKRSSTSIISEVNHYLIFIKPDFIKSLVKETKLYY